MSTAKYQATNQKFTAFFNRVTKARLSGAELAPALAEAVGAELAQLNPASDLPPDAARHWNGFVETYITFGGPDPLSKLRQLGPGDAETAMERIGDVQQVLSDSLRRAR